MMTRLFQNHVGAVGNRGDAIVMLLLGLVVALDLISSFCPSPSIGAITVQAPSQDGITQAADHSEARNKTITPAQGPSGTIQEGEADIQQQCSHAGNVRDFSLCTRAQASAGARHGEGSHGKVKLGGTAVSCDALSLSQHSSCVSVDGVTKTCMLTDATAYMRYSGSAVDSESESGGGTTVDFDQMRVVYTRPAQTAQVQEQGRVVIPTSIDIGTVRNTMTPPDAYRAVRLAGRTEVSNTTKGVDTAAQTLPRPAIVDVAVWIDTIQLSNVAHAFAENLLPLFFMLSTVFHPCLPFAEAVRRVADTALDLHIHTQVPVLPQVEELLHLALPKARVVFNAVGVVRARRLVVGTGMFCAHSGHCSGVNFPYTLSASVRRSIQTHAGVLQRVSGPSAIGACPMVTIVQRSGTRALFDVQSLVTATQHFTCAGGQEGSARVRVVNTVGLSLVEQLQLFMHTDVAVMVHGAAMLNALFLPAHAGVLIINPYGFHNLLHNYMDELNYLGQDLRLSLVYLDVTDPTHQTDARGVPLACKCTQYGCFVDCFRVTQGLRLPVPVFMSGLVQVYTAWRTQHATAVIEPRDSAAFLPVLLPTLVRAYDVPHLPECRSECVSPSWASFAVGVTWDAKRGVFRPFVPTSIVLLLLCAWRARFRVRTWAGSYLERHPKHPKV